VCGSRRLSPDDEVPLLQISNEVIGDELRHEIIAMSEPPAAILLKRETESQT